MSTIIRFGAVTEFVGVVVSAFFFWAYLLHSVSEGSTQTPSEGHHCQCFTMGSCFIGNGFLLVVITPQAMDFFCSRSLLVLAPLAIAQNLTGTPSLGHDQSTTEVLHGITNLQGFRARNYHGSDN